MNKKIMQTAFILSALAIPISIFSAEKSTATVTITAVGDVLLGYKAMEAKIAGSGVNYAFENIASELKSADITVCNYESCISTAGEAIKRKEFTFRCSPETINALKFAGIDAVNIANNHTGDYGAEALVDTLEYLERENMPFYGASRSYKQRQEGAVIERNGIKVGFIGFTSIYPKKFWFGKEAPVISAAWPEEDVAQEIREMKKRADIVVASFHWGEENEFYPRESQIFLAHFAIDSGADIVLGHHPHVMQGAQFYRGKPIIYSLGNFVFFPPKEIGNETILAEITADASKQVRGIVIRPVYISNGQPEIASGEKGRRLLEKYYLLCRSIGTDAVVDAENNLLEVRISTETARPEKYGIFSDGKLLKISGSNGFEKEFKVYAGKNFPKNGKYSVRFIQGEWDRGYRFDKDGVAPVNKDFAPWAVMFSTGIPVRGIHALPEEVIISTAPRSGSIGMSKTDMEQLMNYVYIGMPVEIKKMVIKTKVIEKTTNRKPKKKPVDIR